MDTRPGSCSGCWSGRDKRSVGCGIDRRWQAIHDVQLTRRKTADEPVSVMPSWGIARVGGPAKHGCGPTHDGKAPARASIRLLAVASTTAATAIACCSRALALTSSLMGDAQEGSGESNQLKHRGPSLNRAYPRSCPRRLPLTIGEAFPWLPRTSRRGRCVWKRRQRRHETDKMGVGLWMCRL